MRIACPACNATYQVPDDQLAEGRVVRCARCGTDWAPLEAVPESEPEPEPTPEPEPPPVTAPVAAPEPLLETSTMAIEDEIPLPRPVVLPKPAKARMPMLLVIAWVVSVGVVAGAVAGLHVGRERVMAAWPASVRGYAALRLAGQGAPPDGHAAPPAGHGSEGGE